MKLPRRTFLHLAAGAATLPAISSFARAQSYPTRLVRIIVPFAAGGALDVIVRVIANRLSETWHVPVVVENRLGAGGNIGSEAVARSNPDGYTILCNGPAIGLNQYLFNRLPYDPIRDFAPVSLLSSFPNVMTVPKESPANSVAEFIDIARLKAGKISYAIPGVGTTQHLAGELFKRMTGVEMTAVPYRDASFMNDLFVGRVDLMFGVAGLMLEQHRTGRLRALGVTSSKRFPLASELPTIAESGVPGFDVSSWFAFWLPAKISPDILRKLNADFVAVLADPSIQAKVEQLFYLPISSTPEEVSALLKSDMEKWSVVIKEAGIKLE